MAPCCPQSADDAPPVHQLRVYRVLIGSCMLVHVRLSHDGGRDQLLHVLDNAAFTSIVVPNNKPSIDALKIATAFMNRVLLCVEI